MDFVGAQGAADDKKFIAELAFAGNSQAREEAFEDVATRFGVGGQITEGA
jgi:hypothetical protein